MDTLDLGAHPNSFSMVPPNVDASSVPLSIARPPEDPAKPESRAKPEAPEKPEAGVSCSFELKVTTPKAKFLYAEAEGCVAYSVTFEPAETAYKAKEGTLGWFFSYDTFAIVLTSFLGPGTRYHRSATAPAARSARDCRLGGSTLVRGN